MRIAELPRVFRWGLAAAGGGALLVVMLLTALVVAGNTAKGRIIIERLTAALSSGHIVASGLGGSFPDAPELAHLELRDAEGLWLSADGISLRWSPLALLTRHLKVANLQVARLAIERRPIPASPPSSGAFRLHQIDLARVSVVALELGPALAGARAHLSAAGDVHLRSLTAANVNLKGRRLDGEGTYELRLVLTPARIDAQVRLFEPAGGPLQNLIGLPQLGALAFDARAEGPRDAERVVGTLSAGALHGEASGTVDLNGSRTELELTLRAPAMAPRPGLHWQSVNVDGHWGGAFAAPVAAGTLRIEGLGLAGDLGLRALHADLAASGGTLSVKSVIEGLEVPGRSRSLFANTPLALDASLHLDQAGRPLELAASHELFLLHARAITAGTLGATFELRWRQLAALEPLAGVRAEGTAVLSGRISREGSSAHPATRVALDGQAQLRGGGAWWAASLGDSPRFEFRGVADDRSLELERLRLTGRALSLVLSGSEARPEPAAVSTNPPAVHGRFLLDITDLATLSSALAGRLELNGTMEGPLRALRTEADLDASVAVRGSPSGRLTASLRLGGLPGAPRGTLRAQGMLAGAPLELAASLEPAGAESMRLLIQSADWRSAHLQGDVTAGTGLAGAEGRVVLGVGQLKDFELLLGRPIEGRLSGSLAFKPAHGVSQAALEIDTGDLRLGGFAGALQVTGNGPTDALPLKITAQLPQWHGAALAVKSTAVLEPAQRELELATLALDYREQTLRLTSPARISWREGVAVSSFRVAAGNAVLEAGGRILPTLDAHATLRSATPALLGAVAPGVFSEGRLSAEAVVTGSLGSPRGTLRVDARGLRLASDLVRGAPLVDFNAEARLRDDGAQLDGRLEAGKASLLTLQGHAPLAADDRFDLKLLGKLDLALMNPLLEAHGRHAAGVLSVDATVSGGATAPEVGGSVRLTGGDFRDYSQGVHFTEIGALVEGSQGTLHLKSLTARAAPGTVSMTGTLGLFEPKLPIDLQLTAHNARPIASNLVTADLDADLRLNGTLRERLDLSGSLRSSRTQIEIPDSLPPDVAVLDVRRPGQAPRSPGESKLEIGLDVSVKAPNQVLVHGRGLSAELGGEVHIAGTTAAPLVTGGFELIRGTFSLASTQLNFTTGEVSFNGAGLRNRIDPTLDFTAQTTVLDVTAILKITGLADAPLFTLTSTPELPQDEILARLLFGESASQLSTLQVAEIGVALTSLSGSGSALNPLVRLQKTLGLDRLAVGGGTSTTGNSTNTGATVEAGRYVTKRVYVGAKQSTTGATQLQIQVDLTQHLKLQSQLGNGTAPVQGTTPENDPGSSVGISYQFEY
jgi:translocation and assembly module TamB